MEKNMITGIEIGMPSSEEPGAQPDLTVRLHWDPDHCSAPVRIVGVYAADKVDDTPVLLLNGPRHQCKVESFNADCGTTMLSTQEYRQGDPATLLHFGLGKPAELSVATYRTALTAALRRVASSIKCDRVVIDLDN